MIKFHEQYGHTNVPKKWSVNAQLATWVIEQRKKKRKGLLEAVFENQLNKIGFSWNPLDDEWEKMFDALKKYIQTYGHCHVPPKWSGNLKLSHWVQNQRSRQKQNKLPHVRILRLDEIGFKW